MRNELTLVGGHSPLAPLMEQFVQEKRACGYRYVENALILRRFDAFLCQQGLQRCELLKSLIWQWLAKQPHENSNTQLSRISVVGQFAMFLVRMGHPADVPDRAIGAKAATYFMPRILTHDEIRRVIDAVDSLEPDAQMPMRHVIMPEVFRLLYGCGLRLCCSTNCLSGPVGCHARRSAAGRSRERRLELVMRSRQLGVAERWRWLRQSRVELERVALLHRSDFREPRMQGIDQQVVFRGLDVGRNPECKLSAGIEPAITERLRHGLAVAPVAGQASCLRGRDHQPVGQLESEQRLPDRRDAIRMDTLLELRERPGPRAVDHPTR